MTLMTFAFCMTTKFISLINLKLPVKMIQTWKDSFFKRNFSLRIITAIFLLPLSSFLLFFGCLGPMALVQVLIKGEKLEPLSTGLLVALVALVLGSFGFFASIRFLTYLVLSKPFSFSKEGVFIGRDKALFGKKFNWAFYKITNSNDVFIPWNKIERIEASRENPPWLPFNLFAVLRVGEEFYLTVLTKEGKEFKKTIHDIGGFQKKGCHTIFPIWNVNIFPTKEEVASWKKMIFYSLIGLFAFVAYSLLIEHYKIGMNAWSVGGMITIVAIFSYLVISNLIRAVRERLAK